MFLYRERNTDRWIAQANGVARRLERYTPGRAPRDEELGDVVDLEAIALGAPVLPGKILCVGRSYRAHAEELGNPIPDEPVLFLKAPSALIGAGEAVRLPPESAQVEYEGELAIVVGQRLSRADEATAAAAIFGVTCACDVTARDLQRRDPCFSRGKSFDTFCPVGPALALGIDPEALTVTTRLNGEVRQQAPVAWMMWRPAELLAYASRMMTLEAGDLFLTGTPAGVGQLEAGDQLEVEIEGVGRLANPVSRLDLPD